MSKSLQMIAGMGMICALFMAMMSMVYLQHLPSEADLERLETDLRSEFDMVLETTAPLKLELIKPTQDEPRFGVSVACTMRTDIRRRPTSIKLYLDRIGASILLHPEWKGKISQVTVRHVAEPKLERVVRPGARKTPKPQAKRVPEAPPERQPRGATPPPQKRAAAGGK